MTIFESVSGQNSGRPVVTRLEILPSDDMKELVGGLYRPSRRNEQMARLALKSKLEVPLEVYPGGVYFYDDGTGHNGIQNYMNFSSRTLPQMAGHQLPLLSHLRALRADNGALRIETAFGVGAADRPRFRELREFRSVAGIGVLYANLDISPENVIPNEDMVRIALSGLASSLGLNHPAREKVPIMRRVVDSQRYYAKIGRGLVRGSSESATRGLS